MDVIDQDKLAMEERLDKFQAQLLQVQDTLSKVADRDRIVPVGPSSFTPMPSGSSPTKGRAAVEPARSASPGFRDQACPSHLPQFGDSSSIFASRRGRSATRDENTTDGGRPHGGPPLGSPRDGLSPSHNNIVRVAS
eukprot:1459696-Amphidinium_carterae.1